MPQYLNLPSGNSILVEDGVEPQQAWLDALRNYPEEFGYKKGSKAEGGFGAAFSSGLSRLAGETGLTAGKLGLIGLPAAEEYYRRQQQKAEGIFKPTEKGWTEDPLQKLKEVAGGSAAYMLAPAVAAGAAAFAPVTVPVIGAAGLAAGLAGLGQYTGSNLAAQMEENKKGLAETSGAAAFGTAIPQAALDVLSFRMMPGIQRLFGATGKELTEAQAKALAEQTLKKKIGDYAKATGVSMGVEGATEVAQDFLEKAQAGAELTDPKAREDYLESLIGGAALAGVLGPFGRGFERAGIAARGRELEQKRVEGERALQQSLTGLAGMERTRAAGAEARQQFGTLFPEIGPAESMYGTQESIQKRLAQIEQEAERARQLKDVSTLSDLQRERTALESRVKEEPSAMEQRQALEQQIAYYQNIEAQLIARAKAAPTAAEKRLILEKLVQVQEQRRQLTNTLLAQEQTGAVPKPTTQEALLNQEKRTIAALQKAEEAGDAAAQLKLTDKLAGLQEQLGLFGQEAYTAQQQFEQKQAEDAAAAEAAARAAQPTLLLTDQRGATPIEMGYNLDTVITPPRVPQAYLQGNLFGSEERVQAPGGTETTLPRLQQAVSSLSERPDLSEADRSLLDRVSDLVLPKRGERTVEGLRSMLGALQTLRRSISQDILNRATGYDDLGLTDAEKLARIRQDASQDAFKSTRLEPPSIYSKNDADKPKQLQQAGILRLNRRLLAIEKKEAEIEAQATKLQTARTPIERFTTPIETRDAEGNVKTRATPAQLVADWVEALSSGADTTQPRAALETVLGQIQRAGAGEKEALTKLKRRIATPEERAALGKKSVVERVPTAITTTAQQPDLFAGTEAATATEFETPRQMQAFMASDELQKERQKQGKQALAEAQEAGPPKPADVVRSQKLLKPTVAFLNKQADKVRGFLKGLTKRLNDYNALLSAKTEQDEDALAKAKRQQAEILLAIEKTLLKQHQEYARALIEMQSAQETMAGLQDFVDNYVRALDTAVQMSGEWAGVAENERARFQKELEARQDTLRRALGRLGVLRGEITNKFGDILSMEAPALEAGTAFDPELVAAYTQAKADAKKAADDFYGFVKARRKVEPPAHWKVSERDLRQFLMQQAELTDMLFEQGLVVKKWTYTAEELHDKLTAAQEDAKADPVWSAFLKEAQEAIDDATSTPTLRSPDKLMAAIRAANVQIRNIRDQRAESLPARILELEDKRKKLLEYTDQEKLDATQVTVADTQKAIARINAAKREQLKPIDKQLAELRRELAQTKGDQKPVSISELRAKAQAKTQADIKAENERLAREAEAKTRVSFEKRSKKEREEIAALQQRLDQLVADKQTAIDKKREQTTHFRFTKDEKEAIAAGTKTREQVIEAKREEGVKALTAQFDAAIQKLQVEIRAIRGVAKPSEKRAAQLQSTLDLQRRIGEEGPLETAEEVATIAKTQRESRSGQTLVDVRTGRVTEGRMPSAAKALTEAQERREAIEANEISYRNSLLRYVKTQFDSDLSALETDELEYEILRMQAEAEDRAGLRRPATAAEQAKLAKTVAEGVSDPLDRILSHDYAARENTPLDDTTAVAVGKGDLKGALESLAKNGSTPFVRMVAKQLLPMVENTKLETASLEGKGGEYSPNTDTVTLNKDALTEEDLLHEAGHAATYAVASYEAGSGMTRRQFLKGAVTGLTALKLPNITENMSLAAQEKMFFNMLDAWRDWVKAANKLAPALDLDAYTSLDVADGDLRGFLERMEYNDVSDDAVTEMLENGGLKKLQSAINASQRAVMSEAAKQGEAKGTTEKEAPFVPTKEQLAARDALEKLYAKMQGRTEFKDEYGNVSFKEFVSELLSNQQVRDKINQTAGLLRRIYEGFLRMLGIEPKTLSDKALEQAFAMFSPSTTSVGKDERLASIMRGVFPGTQSNFSASVPKSIADMVNRTIARNATLGDKVMANLTGLRLRTFIADQWAPVEALMKQGVAKGKVKEAQALQMQVYMRLFSNMQEYTNSALINGVPELKKDAAGIRNIEGGDEKVNARAIAKALGKASALGDQQAVERTFTLWMASLRAKQDGVGLDKLNFKTPPTAQELADLEQMLKANPTVKDAFEEAREIYRHYNRRLLDLQVQTGTLSKATADELAKGDYVGFYRVNNNGVVELMLGGSRPVRVGNIIDQPYLKELVGGEQQILPFFASMAQNTSLLMSMALKNMQHTNTAYMFQDMELGKIHGVKEGKQPPEGKLRFKQDGKDYWFAADTDAFKVAGVPEDLMLQGLQGVKTAIPALVKALAFPANVLRKAVRRVPIYTLRQTIRDPMHAWLTTGGNFVPVVSTWKELYRGMTNPSQTQITLKQAAVIGNNVYSGDSEGVVEMLRELTSTPSKFSQIITKFDELAMQGEAATRAVLYDDFRKRGMSHVEALLNTAETMNFSRRGTSASLHWLAQLTPFFNAQIQGLDAAYRALRGQTTFEEKLNARNALLKRGAMMAVSTMVYALMMEDDETYKNATPEERYGNWFVRVPGTEHTVRVPIPFELGLIFKSIPEALVNTAFGDKKASEAAKALAKQIYMSSPFGIPTALKGPLEVMFNYNMYSDQPIETAHERSMDVDQRYRTGTTELAKLLGKFGVLSPVQIDHLVRSYTGSLGIMVASMANMALRPLSGRTDVEKPDMSLNEVPVIGAAFQPTTGRGMVNAVFDEVAKYQQAAMTYKNLAKSDPEAAREYANKFSREIALASTGGSFRQQMGEFAQYKRMIAANPNLTGAEKREQIEKIKQQEIEYSKRVRLLAA